MLRPSEPLELWSPPALIHPSWLRSVSCLRVICPGHSSPQRPSSPGPRHPSQLKPQPLFLPTLFSSPCHLLALYSMTSPERGYVSSGLILLFRSLFLGNVLSPILFIVKCCYLFTFKCRDLLCEGCSNPVRQDRLYIHLGFCLALSVLLE